MRIAVVLAFLTGEGERRMEEWQAEANAGRRKKGVRLAAAIFFGGMLVLTFFSNTYSGLTLPKIQVDTPSFGALSYTIEGRGTLDAHHAVSLYDRTGWEVKQLNVEEGDRVTKGQVLVEFDTEAARRSLLDEQTRYHKLELQLAGLQDKLKENAAVKGTFELDDAKREIASLQGDMAIQSRRIEGLQQELDEGAAVTAPFDGVITDLHAEAGLPVPQGQPAVIVADLSQGFDMTVTVSEAQAERITLGRNVNLNVQGEKTRVVKATVAELEDAPSGGAGAGNGEAAGKLLTLTVKDASLKIGDRGYFQWTETDGKQEVLIPSDAIHHDDQGEYVFVLKEVKKPLGNEFYVQTAYVQTGDSDDVSTAIVEGLMPTEKIVTDSSDPLSDGDRVRIN
jgi:HlyD family secretion protein